MSTIPNIPDFQRARFIDIGVNLTDPVFRGNYRGRQKHDDDMHSVLERARQAGVRSMIVTGGSLRESEEAIKLAKEYNLYATAGCHPTRTAEFDNFESGSDSYYDALDKLIEANLEGPGRVVAVGECGLDYDRTHFADPSIQQKYFRCQLALAKKHHLPLFLHSRSAHDDFVRILHEEGFGTNGGRAAGGAGGVVHSFTGSTDECIDYMEMGFYVGVNGCSLKTDDNVAAVKAIRLEKIMLETDAPWCTMTSTHVSKMHLASLPPNQKDLYFPQAAHPGRFIRGKPVKGRNEPCAIGGVAWAACKAMELGTFEDLTQRAWSNTVELFKLHELD